MSLLRVAVPAYAREYFNSCEIKRQFHCIGAAERYRLRAKSLFRRIKRLPLTPAEIHDLVNSFFDDLTGAQREGLHDGEKVLVPTTANQAASTILSSVPEATGRDYPALYHELLRQQDVLINGEQTAQQTLPIAPPLSQSSAPLLSDLIDLRLRMLRATGKAEKTILAAGTAYNQFKRMLPDQPVDSYTAQDFMQMYEEYNSRLAPRTAHQRMIAMSTLMNYAVQSKLIKESPCPVFPKPKALKRAKGWIPYTEEDFEKLRQSKWFEVTAGETKPKDYRGWIPLISRFSGLRLEEVAQLHTADIQMHEGVMCFNVNDDGPKRVKSDSSIRLVPTHQHLIDLGINSIGDGERLFPELHDTRGRGFSHAYSKTYGRYARKHVTEDRAKVFHSLRKMFAKGLAGSGVHREEIGQLLGHEAADAMTVLYAGQVSIARLKKAIDTIQS